jgi:hypothetical protein
MLPFMEGVNYVPMRLMYYLLNSQFDIHAQEKPIIRSIYLEKYQAVNKIRYEGINFSSLLIIYTTNFYSLIIL